MSFWVAAKTAWTLGHEYSDAWDAARESAERGEPVSKIVEAFASRTESKLDNQLAAELIAGLSFAIGHLQDLALWLAEVAEAIEANAPTYLLKVRVFTLTLRTEVPKVLEQLDSLALVAAGKAEQVRQLATVAGVLCVRAVTRLERLRA